MATTAPELSVSFMAALRGIPEMALGNAIGSVICDDGLALGLAGIFAASPIVIIPAVLKSSGIFLIVAQAITFLFVVFDKTLNRWEGFILVVMFVGYIVLLFVRQNRGDFKDEVQLTVREQIDNVKVIRIFFLFVLGLAGIIFSSKLVITSATAIANCYHIPETVIAMTLVAFGTSVPEVATCITAARKGEGAIAVGNILGADIMNICWVAGASAMAYSLELSFKDIFFMFPAMFIIVCLMLFMLRLGYSLNRTKGFILFLSYILYLAGNYFFFSPST